MELEQHMVQVRTRGIRGQMKVSSKNGKQKQEEPIKDGLELQEYVFDGKTPSKLDSKEYFLNTYRETADKTFDETVRLYDEIR